MSIDHQITSQNRWPVKQTAGRIQTHCAARQLLDASRGVWKGCDWEAPLGPEGILIRGLRARHAHLLSAATSGEEASAWLDAARYLESLEGHARQAESAASEAVEMVEANRWAAAIELMQLAVELEAQYREPQTWLPLLNLIETMAS